MSAGCLAVRRRRNDEAVVLSRISAAALDGVTPLTANAPVAADGDAYGWHIDGDPMLLPNGPWTDFHGRYPNRAPGKPRWVSAVIYLPHEWRDAWGAPTRFLDPPTREILDVAAAPGRVVLLDQDVTHSGQAPSAAAGDRPRYSLVLKLGRDTCKLFERDRFATKKELAELKKLAADASALFPTDFHDAKPKRVKKKFVEQKRAETAGTTQ